MIYTQKVGYFWSCISEPICPLFLFSYGFWHSPFAFDSSNAILRLSDVFLFSAKDNHTKTKFAMLYRHIKIIDFEKLNL